MQLLDGLDLRPGMVVQSHPSEWYREKDRPQKPRNDSLYPTAIREPHVWHWMGGTFCVMVQSDVLLSCFFDEMNVAKISK